MVKTALKRYAFHIGTIISCVSMATPALANDVFAGSYHPVAAPVPTAQTYTVGLNKTEVVRLPSPASAVLVGNPAIADVSIHSSDTIFVIGRSYGETNILILDNQGQTILDADIQVNNVLSRNGVRVFYGSNERETFNCTPYCAAAPILGDTPGFIGRNSGANGQINNTIALGGTSAPSDGIRP